MIRHLSFKKTDAPMLLIDGLVNAHHPFHSVLTYSPDKDAVVFTTDLDRRTRIDGQINSFSKADQARIHATVHDPASVFTLGNRNSTALAVTGTFSSSAEWSADLSDFTQHFWNSEKLLLDGATDIRKGTITPFNLPLEILREAGQIPALTQLSSLVIQKALPKSFYLDETPFELLRFMIKKEGRFYALSRMIIKHKDYLAAAEGTIDPINGILSFRGDLVLSDDLSQQLFANVPRLDILQSKGGRLALPFEMTGNLKSPKIHADISQITQKLISAYRTELVRRGNARIEILES